MKNEFVLAFNEVLEDKQLPKEVVLEALQAAMVSAYRRAVNASNAQQVEAIVDSETGHVSIFAEKEVVDDVEDPRTEVALADAKKVEDDAEIGSMVVVETTPKHFGRVAAQTARQVIQQRIREAEREVQFDYFSKQIGEILSGVVQALGPQGVTLGLEMKAEGIMPRQHQIPNERFRVHDRVRAMLLEVKTTPRGPQIVLSRAHRSFLRRLLENEVPEIYHGMVEIRSIAREPGHRSKVAVAALQSGVDPVGACVGIRGVRIQAIVRELNDEKIDVIEWNTDPSIYIAKALSPARVAGVYLNEPIKGTKTATVVVPEDQLSLAIGRDGQNARLAAKLTSWRIDIKSLPESALDVLHKLDNDPEYAELLEKESENRVQVVTILDKKSEGRPVTPEEYQVLTQFVDRVERTIIQQRDEVRRIKEERIQIELANVPTIAFEIPLSEFDVTDHVYNIISEAGFDTVGDLMLQMRLEPDEILAINGMGPKALAKLTKALDTLEAELEQQMAEAAQALAEAEREAEAEALAADAVAEEVEADSDTPTPEVDIDAAEKPVVDGEPAAEVEVSGEGDETAEALTEKEVVESIDEPEAGDAEPIEEPFAVTEVDFDLDQIGEEDEEELKDQKKKQKKKYREIEYDPDQDVMLVKKKRKRAEDDLDWKEW